MGRHDEEKLRRFLAARRSGDEAAARRLWDDLLTDNFDRVRGMVATENRGRLSHDEQQEALQTALIKIANNMIETFRGVSMGEWINSTRKLVHYACIDTQRAAARISKRQCSLDAPGRDGEDDIGRWDRQVSAIAEERHREEEDDAAEREADAAFLDWAVPQLKGHRRSVIERSREGVPVEEIQQRLRVSREVVYQSRSRALKELARLREQHRA